MCFQVLHLSQIFAGRFVGLITRAFRKPPGDVQQPGSFNYFLTTEKRIYRESENRNSMVDGGVAFRIDWKHCSKAKHIGLLSSFASILFRPIDSFNNVCHRNQKK